MALNYQTFPMPKTGKWYQWGGGAPFTFTTVTDTAVSYRFEDGTEIRDVSPTTFRQGLAKKTLRELRR